MFFKLTNSGTLNIKFSSIQLLRHILIFRLFSSQVCSEKRRVNTDNGVNQHKFLAYRYKQEDYHFIL